MTAKLKASSTFTIIGWGLALSGEILEGTIRVGMKVWLPEWRDDLTISDIGPTRRLDGKPEVALLFRRPDEQDYAEWKALDLKDQIIDIS